MHKQSPLGRCSSWPLEQGNPVIYYARILWYSQELLDLLIGFNRVVPRPRWAMPRDKKKSKSANLPACQLAASFVGFPALNAFKTPEAQVTVIVKVGFLTIFKIFLETLDVTWQAVQSLQKAPTSKCQIHLRKLESWECRLLRSCSWTSCLQRHSPRLLAREGNTNPVHSSTWLAVDLIT